MVSFALHNPALAQTYLDPDTGFVDLSKPVDQEGLVAFTQHFEDASSKLTLDDVVAQSFVPLTSKYIDFGFSQSVQWIRISIRNPTDQSIERLLSFNMRFMQDLDAYLVGPNGNERLMANDKDSPFGARAYPYRHLVTPFSLPGYAHATLYIRYWSEGTTALPLSIETPLSFEQRKGSEYIAHAAFYAFVAVLIIYSLLFGLLSRQILFGAYAFYLSTVVLYLAHMDGYTFQFLWPDAALWNASAALPLGMGLNVGAAVFSIAFLQTRQRHKRLHWVIVGLALFCMLYVASGAVISQSALKQFAFPITLLFAFFYLGAGLNSYSQGYRDVRFYIVGWFGMSLAATITTVVHFAEGDYPVSIAFEIIRLGILIDATMMGIAVVDQFNSARKAHNEAQAQANKAMAEHLEMQRRFMALEERFNAVNSTARERGLQLAEASHDLRQPLAALRASMGGQSTPLDVRSRQHIRQTIEYLENLVDRYLVDSTQNLRAQEQETTPSDSTRPNTPHASTEPDPAVEAVPVQVIFDNLNFMFELDAEKRDVDLRFVPSSLCVHIDPIVLVRLLSNAIANSIRFTPAGGRVLLGCRRRGKYVAMMVLDNGAGFTPEALDSSADNGRSASQSEDGFGLGLAITRELASSHGIEWHVGSEPGQGTSVSFLLPTILLPTIVRR